jgi:hypothetical protein
VTLGERIKIQAADFFAIDGKIYADRPMQMHDIMATAPEE